MIPRWSMGFKGSLGKSWEPRGVKGNRGKSRGDKGSHMKSRGIKCSKGEPREFLFAILEQMRGV